MLQFFRKAIGSKIGAAIALLFLGLIALAFAGGDVSSSLGFGTGGGGGRAATVGGARIDTADVERQAGNAVERLRQEQPGLTVSEFAAKGGLEQILDNLIDLTAIRRFGELNGIHLGDRLIDSEIAKIPTVQGADGKVSDQLYRAFLGQRGVTDKQFRAEIGNALMARQLLSSTDIGVAMPNDPALRYAGIITETRSGEIALLPSALFAPAKPPSDAELAAYYNANKANYMQPERRTIRYAVFGQDAVKSAPAPTEAEIAARYNANKAQYAASENRKVSQLVLFGEADARAVAAAVAGGQSLEAAARAKGLSVAALGSLSKEALSGQTSAAIADAAFKGAQGKVVGPIKGTLGWVLLRIDGIEGKPARSLDQVRPELTKAIAEEKRRTALTDFSAQIEEEFDNGTALSDVAKNLGLTLSETAPLTADGKVWGQQGQTAPAALARVIPTAFAMEGQNQPQLAEVEPGKTFVVFDVGAIAQAAPPPLAQVREAVTLDYKLSKGTIAAKAVAQKIEAQVRKGTSLSAAMAGVGIPGVPPVDKITMPRQQLQAMQQVPPPLVTMFKIAKGSVRLLGAPRNRGWYIVTVTGIQPGQVAANDPRLGNFKTDLGKAMGSEYSFQLRAAMRKEVGVERNADALAAVKRRLTGAN